MSTKLVNRGDKASAGKQEKGKLISWNELEKHNVETDCWLAVRQKVYNVTSWIERHPGGKDTIVLNGGRDATQLFEAYHPLKVNAVLEKYYIGELEHDPSRPVFPPMSDFYLGLKTKLENYFTEKNISPRYAPEMIFRSIFLVALSFVLHYYAVSSSSWFISGVYAALAGFTYALISFMPVHEGSHASTTSYALVWRMMGAVHDFVNGASFYTWCHQHFLGHHPFTNLTTGATMEAIDPDVSTNDPDIRRIKPHQPWHKHYKLQQFYVPVLYGLLGIKYRINDFTIMFVTKMNGAIRVNPPDTWHMTCFLAGKAFFFFYRIVLPAYFFGLSKALFLFVVSDLVTSYTLAFVFQVNHVIPQAKWPVMDKDTGKVNMDWAEMQVRTTLDYAHGSWLTTFMTGALNYQVTHHLVPYISQIHYPAIAPIIKKHCEEHKLPYFVLPTFTDALKAHLEYLRIMGKPHDDY